MRAAAQPLVRSSVAFSYSVRLRTRAAVSFISFCFFLFFLFFAVFFYFCLLFSFSLSLFLAVPGCAVSRIRHLYARSLTQNTNSPSPVSAGGVAQAIAGILKDARALDREIKNFRPGDA